MSTSDKLIYLNGTKQALKESINNLGGDITSETTFREYAQELEGIYDILPKTNYEEGSNITLSNTLKGKLDFEDDIVGYGDTSQKSYEGYNLLDINTASTTIEKATFTKLDTGYNVVTDNTVGPSYYGRLMVITSFIDSSKTYAFSCDVTCNEAHTIGQLLLGWVGASKMERPVVSANIKTHIFGTYSGITTTVFSIASYKPNATIKVENFQIYEGSTDKTYEPYTNGASPNPSYPQEIEVVRGKNRLKLENGTTTMHNVTSVTKNGKITLNGTPNSTDYISLIGTYVANTTDTFTLTPFKSATNSNIRLLYTINDGSLINSDNTPQISLTRGDILKVYLRISSTSQIINFTLQPQLEKGSQATSYLPYNTLEVKARGKNKLDFSEWLNTLMNKNPNITAGSIDSHTNNSITITSNGSDCFTASYTISNNAATNKSFCETYPSLVQEVKGNTKYTFSFERSNTSIISRPAFFFLDKDYNYLGLDDQDRTAVSSVTFTTPSNAKYMTFRFGLYGSTGSTLTISNIMIEESPSATTYEPYYTPQIKQLFLGNFKPSKIGNYKDYFYRTSGKNLFDGDVEQGAISSTVGETYAQNKVSNATRIRTKDLITLNKNETYTISCKSGYNVVVQAFNDNKTLYVTTGTNSWVSNTTISNVPYIAIAIKKISEANITPEEITNAGVQLELGNTATDYNPYGSGEWYFKANINNVTYNGSESGWEQNTTTLGYRYRINQLDIKPNADTSTIASMYSNYFKATSPDRLYNNDNYSISCFSGTSHTIIIACIDSNTDTLEKWKTWLGTHNTEVYYVLDISTDTKITDTNMITQLEDIYNLMSYTGTTILEVDGDLPMIIKARALKGE